MPELRKDLTDDYCNWMTSPDRAREDRIRCPCCGSVAIQFNPRQDLEGKQHRYSKGNCHKCKGQWYEVWAHIEPLFYADGQPALRFSHLIGA